MMHKTALRTLLFSAGLFFLAVSADAATLSVVADKSEVKIGDELIVNIKVDTEGKSVNAAQSTVTFPKNLLEVASVDKAASVFNFWLEDPFVSNQSGTISFTAGSSNGFTGKSLQVVKIVFKVKGNGSGDIGLKGSAVTSADGSGANTLSKVFGAKVRSLVEGETAPAAEPQAPTTSETQPIITPVAPPQQIVRQATVASNLPAEPKITVSLYPDKDAWQSVSSNFLVRWDLPSDITDVATLINKDPASAPTKSEGLFDSKTFQALDDGIWYAHVRFKNNIGWGKTAHYRLAIDTVPPLAFEIKVNEGLSSDVPNPTITYAGGDQLSGVDRYEIRIDGGEIFSTAATSYMLPLLFPGNHSVSVIARDKAGNSTEGTVTLTTLPITAPIVNFITPNVYVGEGDLYLSGTIAQDLAVLVRLSDAQGGIVHESTLTPDKDGNWTLRIDTPLKRGNYTLSITARDARGARSFPIEETLRVRPRPLVTVFGIGITEWWFFGIVFVALGAAFVVGKLLERRKRESRTRRTFVLERDATNLIEHIKKDIVAINEKKEMKELATAGSSEIAFLVKRIDENVKKMQEYIVSDMERINN